MTGFRGTFVISWDNSEIDGLANAPRTALQVGASWSWTGEPIRVDGMGSLMLLGEPEGAEALRRRAARSAERLVGTALSRPESAQEPEDPLFDRGFAITDGMHHYTVTVIDREHRAPLLLFTGKMPAPGSELWITHVMTGHAVVNRIFDTPTSVICFTPDTCIATPDGPRPAGELAEGELVLTRDDGPQPVVWTGQRRMSGARLFALPELRPVRIRTGAMGADLPDEDLLVSPDHRMLLKGDAARALFGEPEVLVRARDMLNDRSIVIDHHVQHVTYVHLMFERHQIVWANGLESESFHPGSMALEAIGEDQRARLLECVPELARDTAIYGDFARRALTTAEAAIMRYGDSQQALQIAARRH